MAYLIQADYKKFIQLQNMLQVLGSDLSILNDFALTAQEEAISYLIQKYDTSVEFTDTELWDITQIYQGKDRVYLDAPAYVTANTYHAGDTSTTGNKFYICIATTTGTFDPSKWSVGLPQYQLYYVALPHPEFDINKVYAKGDQVTWNGKIYTCIQPSAQYDTIQYQNYQNIPPINAFPDAPITGAQQWGTGTPYSIPANTPITSNLWTQGDNRGRKILQTVVNICLYYCHDRISPQNIPELRVKNYDEAIKWLKMAGRGEITPNLPKKQPNQGNRIRFGGTPKVSFNI